LNPYWRNCVTMAPCVAHLPFSAVSENATGDR
jgi:hypothetical protein